VVLHGSVYSLRKPYGRPSPEVGWQKWATRNPAAGLRGRYFLPLTTGVTKVASHMIAYAAAGSNHHHHKHQGLVPRSVTRETAPRASAFSVVQLFSFLVVCSGMIPKGFGFVAFFASAEASSVVFIYLI